MIRAEATGMGNRCMHLPKPVGLYHVAFADFELRHSGGAEGDPISASDLENKCPEVVGAPPMRFFYPTTAEPRLCAADFQVRRWLPHFNYTWGYFSKIIPPSSIVRRFFIWVLTCILHLFLWLQLHCSVAKPMLVPDMTEGEQGRLPVVIFTHGMWACRTTYTLACCDIASHGYMEHLDGSAVAANYTDQKGRRKWITHAYAERPFFDTPVSERTKQLRQRVGEIRKVVDILEILDSGLLPQKSNAVQGRAGLNVKMLQGHIDMFHIAIRGHSFGGTTAVVACGLDKRLKCCVAEDTWWQPMEQQDLDRLAGKVPLLLLNTELFEWDDLRRLRNLYLQARAKSDLDGNPLVTKLFTIKGSHHMDQSDFPVLWPRIFKAAKLSGTENTRLIKDINSRLCLEFLHRNFLPPGTGPPYAVESSKFDKEHLIDGTLAHQTKRTPEFKIALKGHPKSIDSQEDSLCEETAQVKVGEDPVS